MATPTFLGVSVSEDSDEQKDPPYDPPKSSRCRSINILHVPLRACSMLTFFLVTRCREFTHRVLNVDFPVEVSVSLACSQPGYLDALQQNGNLAHPDAKVTDILLRAPCCSHLLPVDKLLLHTAVAKPSSSASTVRTFCVSCDRLAEATDPPSSHLALEALHIELRAALCDVGQHGREWVVLGAEHDPVHSLACQSKTDKFRNTQMAREQQRQY